ncbi:MAG: hypothetical protein ACLFTY_01590 [Candidatus Aenigmatarchaeota archaeon]
MSCELCGSEGSLLEANHTDKGKVMVCRDCWTKLYEKNEMVAGSSCSSCSTSSCGSCGL